MYAKNNAVGKSMICDGGYVGNAMGGGGKLK